MSEHRSETQSVTKAQVEAAMPRDVNINDIGQHTVNSTTTILTAPDGSIATVHLGWVMTLDPMDAEGEVILVDADGNIGEDDLNMLVDGDFVLNHGCEERDYFYVESDPTAARGYATATAANQLVAFVNKSGYKVDPPAVDPPAEDGTPNIRKAPSSQGAIPNSDVKPTEGIARQSVTVGKAEGESKK